MKKLSTTLLLCLLTLSAIADPIGPSRALKIASTYLGQELPAARVKPLRRSATRTTATADTLAPLYFIERGHDEGFVIVSGDDCLPEIIGYTERGCYVEEDMPPAFNDLMRGFAQIIEEAQAAGAPARTPAKAPAGRVAIKPLIQSHWHQTAPYNDLAPLISGTSDRAVTGCTCTAAVMILHYFRRDLTDVLLATTPTYAEGDAPVTVSYPKGTPIQWDLMLNSYTTSYPSEMGHAVAVLNAAFGAAIRQHYGSSTSGYINNIVNGYSTYFNVSSKCEYQNGMSQEVWEERIYNNLTRKQPMVYAGVHPDQGGHAIILDGYTPTNNLYHFNFGWGGSGDGYFTLDANNGIGGFSQQQGMVYDIEPNKPRVTGKLHVAGQTSKRTDTAIRVEVTNNGTLDYSGFNLYWGTNAKQPNSGTAVSDKNTSLKLATGQSGEFTTTFKPTSAKTHYIYLTDKRCNILDKVEVEVTETDAEFTLEAFDMQTSSSTEEFMGETYRLLYNTTSTATATLTSHAQGTAAQPTLRMVLYSCNEETGELERVRNINFDNVPIAPGETKTVEAIVNRTVKDTRYALIINRELNNLDRNSELQLAHTDTIIRFKVCAPTLECTQAHDGVMVLRGAWDQRLFDELATDATYTQYDLTAVTGISGQPLAANPNALFYTATPVEGYNIVHEGHIDDLRLEQGYSFAPKGNHTVSRASYTPHWAVGQWNTLALPFTALVPEGYVCRRPTRFAATAMREGVLTDTLLSGKPYLLMTCNEHPTPITASDVTLCMTPDTTGGDIFEAILTDTVADGQTLVLDLVGTEEVPYFSRVDSGVPLAPFTGVLRDDAKRIKAVLNSTTDQAYSVLGEAINTAILTYDKHHTLVEPAWNAQMLDTIAASQEIFTTMSLTLQKRIKEAATNLLAFTERYKLHLTDKSQTVDFNAYLTNPSFEKGSKEGWNAPSASSVRTNSTLSTLAADIHGSYFFYCEASTATTLSQTVEDLPRGYYRVSALVGTSQEATLFAGDSTATVTPHEWGRFYLTTNTVDSVWVEDGTLTLGVKSNAGWLKADNFHLYYLGDGGITDIDMPEAKPQPIIRQGIYDLFGRRIADPADMTPGNIYIVDGRKMVYKRP